MIHVGDRVYSERFRRGFRVREIEIEQSDGFDHIIIHLEDGDGKRRRDLVQNIRAIQNGPIR